MATGDTPKELCNQIVVLHRYTTNNLLVWCLKTYIFIHQKANHALYHYRWFTPVIGLREVQFFG